MKHSPFTRIERQLALFSFGLRNRHFLLLDLIVWCLIPGVALALRLDDVDAGFRYWHAFAVYALVAIVLRFGVFVSFGLYSRYWRYASVDELWQIFEAAGLATLLIALAFFGALLPLGWLPRGFPRSIPFIDGLLALLASGGMRYSVRLAERLYQRAHKSRADCKRVVIFGAGAAGAMIVREMQGNPQLGLDPVAFLDSDPSKHGMTIHGVRVLGDREKLQEVIRDYQVQVAIIAMPSAPGKTIRELSRLCQEAHLPVKTVPGVFELLDGTVTVNKLRPVDIADLLRRESVVADITPVFDLVRDRRVLVTGAGGSIGSELCRQIARCSPALLVLLGHGENSIFDIHNELLVTCHLSSDTCYPIIADIRDEARIQSIMQQVRPELVFHAAAHKHVPLMEANVVEAVTNNILGTSNVARSAAAVGAQHFVMISTDKAVNPSSVMGATKRVAELIVHATALRTGRSYVAVRFGNVLGSRGSVIPFFKQQIARGGPVTVTHPEMKRYFMTIPEAVELVLQAATMGRVGDVFVLDMGEPIKIVDLARDLIRLSGLEEGQDIDIVFTGLRPGEKMFEELFISDENYARTEHQKIFVARNGHALSADSILDALVGDLIAAAQKGNESEIRRKLQVIVPEYRPPEDAVEKVPVSTVRAPYEAPALKSVPPLPRAFEVTGD